jgi:hypothetical protein
MHTPRLTRREVLSAAGILSAAAALPRPARAESRPITVSHSVSTFVYGQHLVTREKRFFDEEGVTLEKGFFDWDLLVDERQYQEVQKIFLTTKVIEAPIPFQKAVDMSFVRKASQRS